MALTIQVKHNDTIVELRPSEAIPLRLDISRVENGEIGSIFGTFSQEFSVIRDNDTKAFFEYADEFGSTEEIPGFFTELEASVISDNDIIGRGLFSLESINIRDGIYICRFQGHDTELVSLLDGKKVIDASKWDEYLHPYNYLTALRSWSVPVADASMDEDIVACVTEHLEDLDLADGQYAALRWTDCHGIQQEQIFDHNDGSFNFTRLLSISPMVFLNTNSEGKGGYPSGLNEHQFQQVNIPSDYINPYNNSQDVVANGAIFYPLIDQGNDGQIADENFGFISDASSTSDKGSWTDTDTPLKISQLTPAIRLRDVFDVMFDEAGKEYTSRFLTDTMNNCYILTKNYDGLGVTADSATINGFVTQRQTPGFAHRMKGVASAWESDRQIVTVGTDVGSYDLAVGSGENFNVDTGEFIAPIDGTYEFEFSFDYTVAAHDFTRWRRLTARTQIRTDSTNYTASEIDEGAWIKEFNRHTDVGDGEMVTITKTYTLNAGDKVWVDIRAVRGRGARFLQLFFDNYQFRTLREPLDWEVVDVNPGQQFDSDLEWHELLTAIVQQFNLVIYPDSDRTDLYHIEPYNNWINAGRLVDWSDRIDYSKGVTKTPLISEQPRVLEFSPLEDDDVLSVQSHEIFPKKILGSTENVVDNSSTKLDGDKVIGDFFGPLGVANFQPLDATTIIDDLNLQVLHLWEKDGTDRTAFNWAPRIGFRSGNLTTTEVSYIGSTGDADDYAEVGSYQTLTPYNNVFPMSIHFDLDAEYPTHQLPGVRSCYDVFWKTYIENLYKKDNYKLACSVRLQPDDIDDLELNNAFLVNGEKFLINKISGFNLQDPDVVNVELIRFYDNYETIDWDGPDEPQDEVVDDAPRVELSVDDANPSVNDTVTITAEVLNFDDELSETYDWFASDEDGFEVTLSGTGPLSRTLTHDSAETITVTLVVFNDDETASDSVDVNFGGAPPTVSLVVNDSTPENGDTVTVTATYTNLDGATPNWEHDPTSGTTEVVTSSTVHTFTRSSSGTVVVQVDVTNDYGTDSDSVVITWSEAAVVEFPNVTTVIATGATQDEAQLNGYLNSSGGANVTDQGFWILKSDETTLTNLTTNGDKLALPANERNIIGPFSIDATDLDPDSTYAFVAYATNSGGTYYDKIIYFNTQEAGLKAVLWNPSSLTFDGTQSTKQSTLVLNNLVGTYLVGDFVPVTGDFTNWCSATVVGATMVFDIECNQFGEDNPISKRVGYFRATHVESGLYGDLYVTQNNDMNGSITVTSELGYANYGKPAGVDGLIVTTSPTWVRWTAAIEYDDPDETGWISLSPTSALGSTTATLTLTENDSGALRSGKITFTATDENYVPLRDSDMDYVQATFSVVQTTFEEVGFGLYMLDTDGKRLINTLTTNPLTSMEAQPNGAPKNSSYSRNLELDIAPSDATWTATVSGIFGTPFDASWLTLSSSSGTGADQISWTAASNTGGARAARISVTATTGTDSETKTVSITQEGSGGAWVPPAASAPSWSNVMASSIMQTSATLQGTLANGGAAVTDANLYWGTQSTKATLRTSGTKVDGITTSAGAKSEMIAGLTAGTTYYYYWEATNSVGTGESGLNSFTTNAMSFDQAFSGTNSITGPVAGYTLSNLTQATQSGTATETYSFNDISATINSGYEFTTNPTTSGDSLTGNFGSSDQTTNRTISGAVAAIADPTYTATYSITNSISGPAAGYTVPSAPAAQTGMNGDSYSFTDPAVPTANSGYTFTTTPSWSGDSLSGTFGSSNVTVNRTLSGTIVANSVSMAAVAEQPAAGATGVTSVATTTGSGTLAVGSTPSWITNASFTGSTLSFDVEENTSSDSRSGNINVTYGGASTNLSVSQAGVSNCVISAVTIEDGFGGDPETVVTIGGNNRETYRAQVTSSGTCSLSYQWTLGNTNATIFGSSTQQLVTIEGVTAGKVNLTATVTPDGGSAVSSTLNLTIQNSE